VSRNCWSSLEGCWASAPDRNANAPSDISQTLQCLDLRICACPSSAVSAASVEVVGASSGLAVDTRFGVRAILSEGHDGASNNHDLAEKCRNAHVLTPLCRAPVQSQGQREAYP